VLLRRSSWWLPWRLAMAFQEPKQEHRAQDGALEETNSEQLRDYELLEEEKRKANEEVLPSKRI
jgi:hypothetical protein